MAEIEENNFKIGRDFSLLSSLSKSPKSPPAEYPELRPFIQSKEALRDLIGREDSQKSLPSPEDDLSMSAFRGSAMGAFLISARITATNSEVLTCPKKGRRA